MKNTTKLMLILVTLLLALVVGCSNGSDTGPTLPSGPVGPNDDGYSGDQPEPPIPTPYAEAAGLQILDMAWEADGDLVIATEGGALLFTPYGLLKRNLGGGNLYAMANNDTGRGMSYYPASSSCNTDGWDDDLYVSGGHDTVTFSSGWFDDHTADFISDFCEPNITMGWMCPSVTSVPTGFEYHPSTGRTYLLVGTGGTYIGDGEEACYAAGMWDEIIGNVVSPGELCGTPVSNAIISYDQLAPFLDGFFNGPGDSDIPDGDFCIYVDKPVWDCLASLAPYGLGY